MFLRMSGVYGGGFLGRDAAATLEGVAPRLLVLVLFGRSGVGGAWVCGVGGVVVAVCWGGGPAG